MSDAPQSPDNSIIENNPLWSNGLQFDAATTRELYDRHGADYSRLATETGYEETVIGWCVQSMKKHGALGRLLDAGCGSGQLGAFLHKALPRLELHGCDLSPKMAELCRSTGFYAEVKEQNLYEALAYPAASFDAVACLAVLSYVRSQLPYREFDRILKPQGLLCVAFRAQLQEEWGYRALEEDKVREGTWRRLSEHEFNPYPKDPSYVHTYRCIVIRKTDLPSRSKVLSPS